MPVSGITLPVSEQFNDKWSWGRWIEKTVFPLLRVICSLSFIGRHFWFICLHLLFIFLLFVIVSTFYMLFCCLIGEFD